MFLDIDKDGQQWIDNPPEDNMEWISSIVRVAAITLNKWEGVNIRGVYDEVNSFYSDPLNLKTPLKDIVAKATTNNRIG